MALAGLGAIAGLDMVSWGQLMISRPIVTAPVAGFILGDPVTGMWVGVILEVLSLHQLPVGAARYWDTGPAAVAASTGAVTLSGGAYGLLVGAGLGAVVAWCGTWSIHYLRRLNSRVVSVDGSQEVDPRWLTGRHLAAMGLDLGRAGLLTLIAVVGAHWLASGAAGLGEPALGALVVFTTLIGLALGADISMVAGGRRVWVAFGVGVGLGALIWVWLD